MLAAPASRLASDYGRRLAVSKHVACGCWSVIVSLPFARAITCPNCPRHVRPRTALCTPELCCASNESVWAGLHHGTVCQVTAFLRTRADGVVAGSSARESPRRIYSNSWLATNNARGTCCFSAPACTHPPAWWRYSCAMQPVVTTSLHSQCACASAACCSTSILRR